MSTKPSSFFEYFFLVQKMYEQLRKFNQQKDCFRIIDIKNNQRSECILMIQIIGKATVFEITPQEIVTNDQLLEGFSKQDIRTITYFATQRIKMPNYKILIQEFNADLTTMTFKIGKPGSSEYFFKSANQISLDKDLLNQLTQEDAHRVGYVVAMEQYMREKEELQK